MILLFGSCQKAADEVTPNVPSADPMGQLAVGAQWEQGGAVTGLDCPVLMTVVSMAVTDQGAGTVARWVGKATCPPDKKLSFRASYTNEAGNYFEYQTITETDGDVKMVTFYLPSKQ
ncbi:hypothetical protein ASU33_18700 [Solirubrum puertoriconensis]|uniref:Uncharacterized protein n=2 Tax=Solirubrum puertoriconensis TaxID=1751427 RepID=A0A9X0HPH4_SOLP1|nr:hypothetical protein ASU33_18700 [Solirubrum puertoriconensis]